MSIESIPKYIKFGVPDILYGKEQGDFFVYDNGLYQILVRFSCGQINRKSGTLVPQQNVAEIRKSGSATRVFEIWKFHSATKVDEIRKSGSAKRVTENPVIWF